MGAAVGMADEVIANDHHGFDSFKETLGKDLKHVSSGRLLTSTPSQVLSTDLSIPDLLQIVVNRPENLFDPG
jgi:hypothetical protein